MLGLHGAGAAALHGIGAGGIHRRFRATTVNRWIVAQLGGLNWEVEAPSETADELSIRSCRFRAEPQPPVLR